MRASPAFRLGLCHFGVCRAWRLPPWPRIHPRLLHLPSSSRVRGGAHLVPPRQRRHCGMRAEVSFVDAFPAKQAPRETLMQAEDTIFAVSSGNAGRSGVAVIRISGPGAAAALLALSSSPSGDEARLPQPRRATVRRLRDPRSGDVLDEALVLWMPGPRSFTGEDTVELHTHGSRAVVSGVLESLGALEHARPAEAGEFTQRAYGNGRMDLTAVEGLADLLAADTAAQRRQALRQMGGALAARYNSWRETLKRCLAHTEAVIDFGDGEDDIDDSAWDALRPKMAALAADMEAHLNDGRRGEVLRTGVRVAIVGPPNAGKSSLLNLLASRPAAIVSPLAGTTRDVVEVQLDLGGFPVVLSDTAGLRADEEADVVEIEGMRRARAAAADAQLVLLVVDGSEAPESVAGAAAAALKGLGAFEEVKAEGVAAVGPSGAVELENEELAASRRFAAEDLVIVANKMDLSRENDGGNSAVTLETAGETGAATWRISCETREGVDELIAHLQAEVAKRFAHAAGADDDAPLLTRERHRRHVKRCLECLKAGMRQNLPLDLAAEELRTAAAELGRITGEVGVEEILDVIFRDFCIGK